MKTAREIKNRIRQLLVEELDRRLQEAQARLPVNCVFNHRQPLDVRKQVEGEPNPNYNRISTTTDQTLGLCMYGSENREEWPGTICEDVLDAQRCPLFKAKVDKDQIWSQLQTDLAREGWAKRNLPEVAALMWALGSTVLPAIPWWKRLWFWLIRFEPEPLRPILPALPLPDSDETVGS
jgi:hypothetical protein